MNNSTLKASALVTAAAISLGGCAGMSPEQNAAVAGTFGGLAGAGIARGAGLGGRESALVGLGAAALAATVTYIIAKRQATERQRQIAEARARRSYARMSAQRKSKLRAKKVRYIAVDAPKDSRTSPQAQKNVMIWDTQTQQVVGNNVYDVQRPPSVGSTARFDTYTAEYVGTGGG